jgi:hypothetical protein
MVTPQPEFCAGLEGGLGLREVFRTMLSGGSGNASSVFMEEEQIHPWLRPPGLIVKIFCLQPPLRARYSLRVIDDYSQSWLHENLGDFPGLWAEDDNDDDLKHRLNNLWVDVTRGIVLWGIRLLHN